MTRRLIPFLAAVALAVGADVAYAGGRVPMNRTPGQRNHGVRQDLTVPFLTSGRSGFGAYSVAPFIYSSAIVTDPANPQARPVFNLIFYGAEHSFGGRSNGAALRKK